MVPALYGFRMARRVRVVSGLLPALLVELDEDRARSRGVDVASVTKALLTEPPRVPAVERPGGAVRVSGLVEPAERVGELKVGPSGARLRDVAEVKVGVRRVERVGAPKEARALVVVEGDRLDPAFEAGVRAALRGLSTDAREASVEFALGRSADEVEPMR